MMMDGIGGVSMAAGVGLIGGAYAGQKKLSKNQQTACYLGGSSLVIFSIVYETLFRHKHHHGKGRHHHGGQHHQPRRHPPAARRDFDLVGGQEQDWDYIFKKQQMGATIDAGQEMLPNRQPLGSHTGIGMEQRKLPITSLHTFPNNVYYAGRHRIAFGS